MDDKYTWLKNKFKRDVHIFINEINFSDIDKKYINLVLFDDLVFSNKKISTFLLKVENQMLVVYLFLLDILLLIDY